MAKVYLKMIDNELNTCIDKKGRRCYFHINKGVYKKFSEKYQIYKCHCIIFIEVPEPKREGM